MHSPNSTPLLGSRCTEPAACGHPHPMRSPGTSILPPGLLSKLQLSLSELHHPPWSLCPTPCLLLPPSQPIPRMSSFSLHALFTCIISFNPHSSTAQIGRIAIVPILQDSKLRSFSNFGSLQSASKACTATPSASATQICQQTLNAKWTITRDK